MDEVIKAKLRECGSVTVGELQKITDLLCTMTEEEANGVLELFLFLNPKLKHKK